MPTYEYHCDACGYDFEKFQSMSSDPIKKCPKCGKNKVKRLIGTGAGLIFKGSGFYITDYRDKSYAESAKADSGGGDAKPAETKAGETKSDGKTETKPAAEAKPAEKKAETTKSTESKPTKKDKKK